LEHILIHTPINTDVSLFLPYAASLCPVTYQWKRRELLRIPFFWEDDFEMQRVTACWQRELLPIDQKGLKVFNFHPVHIYLNSENEAPYQALKQTQPQLAHAPQEHADRYIHAGLGTRSLFVQLLDDVAKQQESFRVKDLAQQWRERVGAQQVVIAHDA
jgi:hypothetical protein